MPKISIILPLYNAEKYLIPCLESVKNQTFEDFECLCINDGSSDKTQEIVDGYAKDDSRFVPIIQENAGCSEARNTGLRSAKAPYIMFLDQDDFFHPQAAETLLYLIEKHKTDVASFTFKCIDNDFDVKSAPKYDIPSLRTTLSEDVFDDFLTDLTRRSVVVWTRIYKKDSIKGLFFPKDVQPAEDTTFTLKVFHKIKSIVWIDEPLLFYRAGNETSVLAEKITERYINAHIGAAYAIKEHFVDKNLSDTHKKHIESYIADLVYKTCISQVIRWTKGGVDRKRFISFSYPMVQKLIDENIFKISSLKFRRQIAANLFVKKCYKLSRIFL